jgi:hypothetical protein
MNKFYILVFTLFSISLVAQTKADLENFTFTKDTFLNGKEGIKNYSSGNILLPNDYNKEFDAWSGWSISNIKDNKTPGYGNQYSAITGSGAEGSKNYAVTYVNGSSKLLLNNTAKGGIVNGLYITNATYTALSMKSGDAFSKKFGGPSGNDPDFYSVKIKGWNKGAVTKDSVVVYLADFRSADNTKDYITSTWQYVSLVTLGAVDSLNFTVASSDVGAFGINTPTYFCIDQISTANGLTSIVETPKELVKIYPNPTTDFITIDKKLESKNITAIDLSGKAITLPSIGRNSYSTKELLPGIYFIKDENTVLGKISKRF